MELLRLVSLSDDLGVGGGYGVGSLVLLAGDRKVELPCPRLLAPVQLGEGIPVAGAYPVDQLEVLQCRDVRGHGRGLRRSARELLPAPWPRTWVGRIDDVYR